ncbi:hypothetical protein MY10362_007542 [Beauveria mimosiformis]
MIEDPQARPATTFKPADYTRVVPPSLDRPATRHDIANFFNEFIKSDILGLIAIRHQLLADVHEHVYDQRKKDDSCGKLAELLSTTSLDDGGDDANDMGVTMRAMILMILMGVMGREKNTTRRGCRRRACWSAVRR